MAAGFCEQCAHAARGVVGPVPVGSGGGGPLTPMAPRGAQGRGVVVDRVRHRERVGAGRHGHQRALGPAVCGVLVACVQPLFARWCGGGFVYGVLPQAAFVPAGGNLNTNTFNARSGSTSSNAGGLARRPLNTSSGACSRTRSLKKPTPSSGVFRHKRVWPPGASRSGRRRTKRA